MNTKTKVAIGLGLLDITRQAAHAWSAKQEAERDRALWGAGFRADAARAATGLRDRLPDHPADLLPWRSTTPTAADRVRAWSPIALTVAAASAAVVVTAHWIAKQDADKPADELVTDAKMVSAVKAGSQAIDAGVTKVVAGGTGAAAGTAAAVAAGSSAIKDATLLRAKTELDERVIAPAKKKAVLYGSLAAIGLTVYVIVIAVAVQLAVSALG